jgi:hypothetical protein
MHRTAQQSTALDSLRAVALLLLHCTNVYACLAAGPRSYLSSPVEVIDFVVVVLSVANAASGKLLNLNMIRMVRCMHSEVGRAGMPACMRTGKAFTLKVSSQPRCLAAVPVPWQPDHFRHRLPGSAMCCRYTRVLTRTEAGRRSIPYRMIASVPSVTTFMTFFFIVVSTFAILGMQLFGGVKS